MFSGGCIHGSGGIHVPHRCFNSKSCNLASSRIWLPFISFGSLHHLKLEQGSLTCTISPHYIKKEQQKFIISASVTVPLVNEEVEKVHLQKGQAWSVHKFGGTCVGNSERIRNVAEIIIQDQSERQLVVVSAMSKVTDMMYDLIFKAQSRDDSYIVALDAVLEKHKSTALDLLDGDDLTIFLSRLHQDVSDLKSMLQAIYIGTLSAAS
ncbi:hypothetical protein Leryth_013345 [Lithospermum erythrorhizon]|nr:hypothetical protein Leryth_013345 [Lithospermum erythrorhizon]